ncbi:MAG: hypothetical protein PHG41_01765, partial [Actinomycetota bacterium]|nr:hypothetical protein [Actinomycetota bacterium]
MNYFGNKLKSKSIAILLITTIIFWLIPPNLIFGESNDNTLELLQQAADRANAVLAEVQAAADQAATELSGAQAAADQAGSKLADARTSADQATKVLSGAEKSLADALAALDKAAEGDDLTALEQAVAEALASRDAAKAAADQANAALVDAQAAADRANVALADAQAAADRANAALVEAQAAEDQASAELEAYLVEISGEPEKEIMEANLDVLADSQNVEPGGSITYKITVTNTGSIVLSGIEVLDKLPELVIFESGSTGEFNEDLREVSYTIESLEPGEMSEEEIIVYVPVVAEESQTLTNSVIISSMEIAPIEEHVDVVIGELTEEDGESGEEGNEAEAIDEESQQDKNEEVELDEDGAVGEGTVEELTGETAEGEIGEETEEAGEQDG